MDKTRVEGGELVGCVVCGGVFLWEGLEATVMATRGWPITVSTGSSGTS